MDLITCVSPMRYGHALNSAEILSQPQLTSLYYLSFRPNFRVPACSLRCWHANKPVKVTAPSSKIGTSDYADLGLQLVGES